MPHLGYEKNEYGTTVSKHRCDTCGFEFTVVPPRYPEAKDDMCHAKGCASYDPARDLDAALDRGEVDLVEAPPKGRG